jgi:two-component SAPR family response regulator
MSSSRRNAAERGAILFLEDEVLLTLTFEDVLRDLKLGEVATAHTIAEAERILAENDVDIAVLDLNVNGASSVPIARRIAASGGQVIFATGQAEGSIDLTDLDAQVLVKPYQDEMLRRAVQEADIRLARKAA